MKNGVKSKFSNGMIILSVFLILSAFSGIFELLFSRNLFLFGFLISGVFGFLVNLFLYIFLIVVIVSILKRFYFGWHLSLIYFGYAILSYVIYLLYLLINPDVFLELKELYNVFLMLHGFVLLIFVLIFVYIYRRKDHFVNSFHFKRN